MQNSIYKIKYLLFLSWDWEAWCLTVWGVISPPPERNTAWNKGRKCFHCLGAPNNLVRPLSYPSHIIIQITLNEQHEVYSPSCCHFSVLLSPPLPLGPNFIPSFPKAAYSRTFNVLKTAGFSPKRFVWPFTSDTVWMQQPLLPIRIYFVSAHCCAEFLKGCPLLQPEQLSPAARTVVLFRAAVSCSKNSNSLQGCSHLQPEQ